MSSSTHQTEQQQQHYTTPTNSSTVVRLVVISDTHGHHELLADLLPPGDVLIHCGDFCDRGSARHADKFFHWIFNLRGYKDKIVIDGNHDRNLKHPAAMDLRVVFDEKRTKQIMQMKQQEDESADSPADGVGTTHFLQDETIQTRSGIRLHGASWQSCEMQDLSNLEQFTASSFVDVLLVHYVPSLTRGNIVNTIRRYNIPLTLGGHTHWRRGVATIDDNNLYVVVNAASLWPSSVGAVGVSPPVVIDYDIATKRVLSIDCEPHPKRMR